MRYTLLIYGEETASADAPPEQLQQIMDGRLTINIISSERGAARHDPGDDGPRA